MKGWIELSALSVLTMSAIGFAPGVAADPAVPDQGSAVDPGVAQADPSTARQQAWVDCMVSNHTGAECANIVDGAPPPSSGATSSYIPGTGTFRVPMDVAPGVYESKGGTGGGACVWARYASASGDPIDSGSSGGLQRAKIAAGEGIFETTNCRPWTRVG
jgi:hypothetical protein